jgi:2,4-dienoyl-CoA reductase-like NADH-dependent reductase (Old Yellow Enzyme family)
VSLMFPALFESYTINGMEVPNRLVRSATAENMGDGQGVATDRYAELMVGLARGGVGLIVTGALSVSPLSRLSPADVVIYHDEAAQGLKKAVDAVHTAGDTRIVSQLYHTGRQTPAALIGETPIAPSPVHDPSLFNVTPREMTADDIEEVVGQFARAASRAKAAGFDGVQLHGAHGYLIHEFFSPWTNRREDEWGGETPLERMRFLEAVYAACRAEVGDGFPLMIKLSADDFFEGGLDLEQTKVIVKRLADLGIDAVEVSGGFYEGGLQSFRGALPLPLYAQDAETLGAMKGFLVAAQRQIASQDGDYLEYADALKPYAGTVPIMSVSGWKMPLLMEAAVAEGKTDFVSLSRPLVRNPEFPNQIKAGASIPSDCSRCNRCLMHVVMGQPLACYFEEGT